MKKKQYYLQFLLTRFASREAWHKATSLDDWYIPIETIGVIHPILQSFCQKAIQSNYNSPCHNPHNCIYFFDEKDAKCFEVIPCEELFEKIFPCT